VSWEQTEVRWYTYAILILFAQEVPQIALKLKSTILRHSWLIQKDKKRIKKLSQKIRVTSSLLKCPKTKNKAPLMHNLHRGGILTPIGN